jgi:type I restriction enzyme S subunit
MNRVPLEKVAKIERTTASDKDCRILPYVGLEHLEKESGQFSNEFTCKPESVLATKYKFSPKHVLYGKLRPYLNKVVLPDFEGVCTTEILPIKPNETELNRTYLWAYLLSPEFVSWASLNVSGANLPRLSPRDLAQHRIPLPPLAEQKRIAGILARADRLRQLRRFALQLRRPLTFAQNRPGSI